MNSYIDYGTESDEFVEGDEKVWPPTRAARPKIRGPRYPRPVSNLFRISDKPRRGKFTRRVENSVFLTSLYNITEEEILDNASVVPAHSGPFAKLHTSDKHMQMWNSFSAQPEDEQEKRLFSQSGNRREERDIDVRFKRIDGRIQSLLLHNKHLPTLLSALEEELRYCFETDPGMLVVMQQPDSFCRLLVHAISQYLGLYSTSDVCEEQVCIFVECKRPTYESPRVLLADYLGNNKKA